MNLSKIIKANQVDGFQFKVVNQYNYTIAEIQLQFSSKAVYINKSGTTTLKEATRISKKEFQWLLTFSNFMNFKQYNDIELFRAVVKSDSLIDFWQNQERGV